MEMLKNIQRLLKFPFFWPSAALLIYTAIWRLNHQKQRMRPLWKAEEVTPAVTWLPTECKQTKADECLRVLASFWQRSCFVGGYGWAYGADIVRCWSQAVSGTLMGMVAISEILG